MSDQVPLSPQTEDIVLVVDDDDQLRRTLVRTIRGRNVGYKGTLLEARSGDEAVKLIDQHGAKIRLVLSDCEMPGNAQGWDVASRAHAVHIQVIGVMSGRPEDTFKKITVPSKKFPKPYESAELEAWLKENLFPPAPTAPPPAGSLPSTPSE